jgi:hypothetical protein
VTNHQARRLPPSPAVTATGVDHVRLAYDYLDSDDLDGYGSLLDEDVALDRPDAPPGRGRAEVLRMHLDRVVPQARHAIERIIAEGDRVVVTGCLWQDPGPRSRRLERIGFVDVFTLSDVGMLRGCCRYYFAPPA